MFLQTRSRSRAIAWMFTMSSTEQTSTRRHGCPSTCRSGARAPARPQTICFATARLILQITEEQMPWCPEFDGHNRCSSLQTGVFAGPLGSTVGQHRFSQACVVREEQAATQTYTPRYGYFELRAKGLNNPLNHVALWMIGYEDAPERSGEIAIMEIMGRGVTAQGSYVRYWRASLGRPGPCRCVF